MTRRMPMRACAASLLAALVACSGGTGGTDDPQATTPPPPALGRQIDRVGRPLVETMLVQPFDPGAREAALDAWNAASDPGQWSSTFAAELEKSLAAWDGFDTMCGNQLLATPGPEAAPGRYAALAGLLADDRLWLNTDGTTAETYLAVELNGIGIVNSEAGGRRPGFDVVDATDSLVMAVPGTQMGDGVGAGAELSGTTFPYLAAPH